MIQEQSRLMGHLRFAVMATVVLVVMSVGWADVLVYEGFATDAAGSGDNYLEGVVLGDYTEYTGPDKTRTGFSGTWHGVETGSGITATLNATAETDSLSYTGFATGESGCASPYRSSFQPGTDNWIGRTTSYTADASGYYVAALVNFDGASGGGFGFGLDATNNRQNYLEYDSETGNMTFHGGGTSAGTYSTALTSGTHLVVIHYTDETSGSPNADYYTQWEIWIDPDVSGGELPETPDGTGWGIGLYYNGGGTAVANDVVWISASNIASGESCQVDEIYITTSASDFLVPEPATLGLLACGGLAILRRRRR